MEAAADHLEQVLPPKVVAKMFGEPFYLSTQVAGDQQAHLEFMVVLRSPKVREHLKLTSEELIEIIEVHNECIQKKWVSDEDSLEDVDPAVGLGNAMYVGAKVKAILGTQRWLRLKQITCQRNARMATIWKSLPLMELPPIDDKKRQSKFSDIEYFVGKDCEAIDRIMRCNYVADRVNEIVGVPLTLGSPSIVCRDEKVEHGRVLTALIRKHTPNSHPRRRDRNYR